MRIAALCPPDEMHAVCQLMGMNLKRCQVVRGHRAGGGRGGGGQPEVAVGEEGDCGCNGIKYPLYLSLSSSTTARR